MTIDDSHDSHDRPTNGQPQGGTPPLAKRLLTIRETSEVLGVSRSMVYQLVASDDLEAVHIGRSVRIPTAAVDDFVNRLRSRRAS